MATTTSFKTAERSHTSFLAAREKQALLWIAARLPEWVNSDHLTGLGFVSLVAAGGAYWYSRWHPLALLAVIGFLGAELVWGLARRDAGAGAQPAASRYGFYIDHILDAIGTFFLMTGLALSGLMTPMVALAFLIAYLLLSIEIYLATYTVGTFHLSYWSFGPTELRILLSIGNLYALYRTDAQLGPYTFLVFDAGFVIGTAALAVILVQATVRHTVELYRQETK